MYIYAPIKLRSEANIKQHWAVKHKINKFNQALLKKELSKQKKPKLPVKISFTRVAPRQLDYDNLCYAFKNIVDFFCAWLIPGLAAGRADGDPQLKIEYHQRKGQPKEYAIEIKCEAR